MCLRKPTGLCKKFTVSLLCLVVLFFGLATPAKSLTTDWNLMISQPDTQGSAPKSIWGFTENNIYTVQSTYVYHFNGTSWTEEDTGKLLNAVWGSSATDVFAVGYNGIILHYNGTSWSIMASPVTTTLYAVWGSSATDVFAVGYNGQILHYNGTSWSVQASPVTTQLNSIWGSSATDVFAVGGFLSDPGVILHYNGSAWTTMDLSALFSHTFYDVWGSSATDVFAVASAASNSNQIVHYDGNAWSEMTSLDTNFLTCIWGTSWNNVYVGGDDVMLHYNGTNWVPMTYTGDYFWPNAIWGIPGGTIFASCIGGVFYYGSDPTNTSTSTIIGTTTVSSTTTIKTGTTTTTIIGSSSTTTKPRSPRTTTTAWGVDCFMTKVLGDKSPDLAKLRAFRDSTLAQSAVGRKVIGIYYNNAKSVNAALDRNPALRAVARKLFEAAAALVESK